MRYDPVLGLDTSGPWIALALVRGDDLLGACDLPMARGQAEALMPEITRLMDSAGVSLGALARIGVGVGPGNFTGVRMGVALARGLAVALSIPAIGVTRFQARALGLPRPLTVIEDARHDAVYLQEMDDDAPRESDLDALPFEIGAVTLTGSAAAEAARRTGGVVLAARYPLAEAIARIAAQSALPCPRPAPLYLRPADAAPPRMAPPRILA